MAGWCELAEPHWTNWWFSVKPSGSMSEFNFERNFDRKGSGSGRKELQLWKEARWLISATVSEGFRAQVAEVISSIFFSWKTDLIDKNRRKANSNFAILNFWPWNQTRDTQRTLSRLGLLGLVSPSEITTKQANQTPSFSSPTKIKTDSWILIFVGEDKEGVWFDEWSLQERAFDLN